MLFFALFACATGATDDTSGGGSGGCLSGPTLEITSPESSAKLPAGEAVTLSMNVKSETDDNTLRLLWAVMPNGGDTENMGTHTNETWTPALEDVGIWTIFAQAEDECTDSIPVEPIQDTVRVEIVAPA